MTLVKQYYPALLCILLLLCFALLAGESAAVADVLRERINLCLQTLIPSLFGCMALSELLTGSGAAFRFGRILRRPAERLHLPPEVLTVFFVSQIAGYPVGTVLLRRMADAGRLPRSDAARLACVCFGGGPAFLVGLAGVQLFGSAAAGWLMLGACVCANTCLLLLLRPKSAPASEKSEYPFRLDAECLTAAVSRAMRSLAGICGMVLLFGILTALCTQTGLTALLIRLGECAGIPAKTVSAMLSALTDVTQLQKIFSCGFPFRLLLGTAAALLSFGGICVHFQCSALSGGLLRISKLCIIRVFAAILSFAITYLAAGLIPLPESTAAFAICTKISKTGSILPSLLIFCTGFPFLLKKD